MTIRSTACFKVPITLIARYPVFEDGLVGADLTSLWTLPAKYTWTEIARNGSATTYRVTGANVPSQTGLFDVSLTVGPATFPGVFVESTVVRVTPSATPVCGSATGSANDALTLARYCSGT